MESRMIMNVSGNIKGRLEKRVFLSENELGSVHLSCRFIKGMVALNIKQGDVDRCMRITSGFNENLNLGAEFAPGEIEFTAACENTETLELNLRLE